MTRRDSGSRRAPARPRAGTGGDRRAADATAARDRPVPRAPGACVLDPIPGRHPAMIVATVFAALCVAFTVTYQIHEADFWQHLLVGRVIAQTRHVPSVNLWTWPTHGAPDIDWSWGFELLLYPFWAVGGVG